MAAARIRAAVASPASASFDARVQPTLAFCRTCHVPGGVADVDDGRRFMLNRDGSDDYVMLRASWEALGRSVDDNLILQHASGARPHSGGASWAVGSAPYANMRILLGCRDAPANCAALLGNPGKHYFANQLCDGAPDSTPIDWNRDPRRLLTIEGRLIDSEQYAVYFNDPYEICHTDTLFETQAPQNQLRIAQGKKPIYSAKQIRPPAASGARRCSAATSGLRSGRPNQPLMDDHGSGALPITNHDA